MPTEKQTAEEHIAQGKLARKENNLDLARYHYAEAAKLHQSNNNPLAYAHTIRHIADIHQNEQNLTAAQPLYEEALHIYRNNLDTKLLDLANTVRPYALLNERQGNTEEALKLWQEAANLYASLNITAGVDECNSHLSNIRSVQKAAHL